MSGWLWASGGIWAVGCILPGVLMALRPGRAESPGRTIAMLARTYGPEVGSYLGYCPRPVLSYCTGLLFFAPSIILVAALGLRAPSETRGTRDAVRLPLALGAWWGAQSAAGFLIMFVATALTSDAHAWGWTWRLVPRLVISGLPAVGTSTLVVRSLISRGWALGAGVLLHAFLGSLAFLHDARAFVPGGIDRALLTGQGIPAGALALALGWAIFGCAAGSALAARRRAAA